MNSKSQNAKQLYETSIKKKDFPKLNIESPKV
jgi:hypothetical protein